MVMFNQIIKKNNYNVLVPNTSTDIPFNQNHRPDILDIELGKILLFSKITNINDLSIR